MEFYLYLYVKTHNVSGLKYFGYTRKDPLKYKGSGLKWKEHLKIFGNDVSTEIIAKFSSREECAAFARAFSQEHNIAESNEWLNLIPETLGGGTTNAKKSRDTLREKYGVDYFSHIAKNKPPMSEETKEKLRTNLNCFLGGKKNIGKIRLRIICPHCSKEGAKNTMLRWHFENCKFK